jgi:uncharacterized protein YjgD (DUF1641 family)
MTLVTPDMAGALESMSEQMQLLVDEAEERRKWRDSLGELFSDLSPIASQGMGSLTKALDDAEHRGYFDFARNSLGVVDKVASSFSSEDIESLGNNIVLILETFKEMTQPQIMELMRSTFHNIHEVEPPEETPSMLGLLRQMREVEVRRGLARLIVVLRSLGMAEPEALSRVKGGSQ